MQNEGLRPGIDSTRLVDFMLCRSKQQMKLDIMSVTESVEWFIGLSWSKLIAVIIPRAFRTQPNMPVAYIYIIEWKLEVRMMLNSLPQCGSGCCRFNNLRRYKRWRHKWYYKQRVLMHGHQGWNVRHSLCHIYMRYVYIYELFIAFVSFVVCSLL